MQITFLYNAIRFLLVLNSVIIGRSSCMHGIHHRSGTMIRRPGSPLRDKAPSQPNNSVIQYCYKTNLRWFCRSLDPTLHKVNFLKAQWRRLWQLALMEWMDLYLPMVLRTQARVSLFKVCRLLSWEKCYTESSCITIMTSLASQDVQKMVGSCLAHLTWSSTT